MKTLELYREKSRDDGVRGDLFDGEKQIAHMLELPWRENQRGISCIPPGKYLVTYLRKSASGKYRDVYHIQSVPGRFGILIHKGNVAGDKTMGFKTNSDGCLLPNMGFMKYQGQTFGHNSADALQAIHSATGRNSFWLEIYGV